MAARALRSKSGQRRFFMLMGGLDPFRILADFPRAIVGVPYDELVSLGGRYVPPVVVDLAAGYVPPGLTLELAGDGTHLRLYGTPTASIEILGDLPPAYLGFPYSARLQVVLSSGTVLTDIIDGSVPAWMTVTYDSGTNEIEFSGTPS